MNETGWIFGVLCLMVAAIVVFWEYRRTRKTMKTIEQMLDAAMDNSFKESRFDESELSALETSRP